MHDDFEQASNESLPEHSLKRFLEIISGELDEFISDKQELIHQDKQKENPNLKFIAITHGSIFAEKMLKEILNDFLVQTAFLSAQDIKNKYPDLSEVDLEEINVIEEKYKFEDNEWPDHTKYYQYVENNFWKDLERKCTHQDNLLDYMIEAKGDVNEGQMEYFNEGGLNEILNLQDYIGARYEDKNPENKGSYNTVDGGLEHVVDHVNYVRAELMGTANNFKSEMKENNDIGFIAGEFTVGAAFIGAIIDFKDKITYVSDEGLRKYFPELDEETFNNLGWEKVIERLFPENKCPENPEALNYVTAALMAAITHLFQEPDFIVQQKVRAEKEFGPLNLDQFIDGLNAGYKRFDIVYFENEENIDLEENIETHKGAIEAFDEIVRGRGIDLSEEEPENIEQSLRLYKAAIHAEMQESFQIISDDIKAEDVDPKKHARHCGFIAGSNHYLGILGQYLKSMEEARGTGVDGAILPETTGLVIIRGDTLDVFDSDCQNPNLVEDLMGSVEDIIVRDESLPFPYIDRADFEYGLAEFLGFLESYDPSEEFEQVFKDNFPHAGLNPN